MPGAIPAFEMAGQFAASGLETVEEIIARASWGVADSSEFNALLQSTVRSRDRAIFETIMSGESVAYTEAEIAAASQYAATATTAATTETALERLGTGLIFGLGLIAAGLLIDWGLSQESQDSLAEANNRVTRTLTDALKQTVTAFEPESDWWANYDLADSDKGTNVKRFRRMQRSRRHQGHG